MTRTLLLALLLTAACGGKKKAAPEGDARRDGGASAAATGVELRRCMLALEQAMTLPPNERAGTVLRACRLCGPAWDHVLAADRADTGTPVDIEKVWDTVEACGGTCTKQAATSFKAQLAELTEGKPASRPWKALAKDCAAQLHIDDSSERFASGAWYALAMIGDKLHVARATMPAADQTRIDTALASMLMPLPPVSAPGTGYIVPGGGQRTGTPWRHITVTGDAIFVGRLAFAHLSPHGLGVSDGGAPYPGTKLASVAELSAALTAQAAAAPPPPLADRIDEPVIIAPRAAAARIVTDAMAALGAERAFLAVASPAPAAMWRGLVAAHPLPLAARATLPGAPGPSAAVAPRRVRLGLVTARVAIVDDTGKVLASAPLPEPSKSLVQRWTLAAVDLAGGQAIEIVAEEGKVDALAALLDVTAGNGAVIAVPAAAATLTGGDLPAYDAASLKAALGPPGARTTP